MPYPGATPAAGQRIGLQRNNIRRSAEGGQQFRPRPIYTPVTELPFAGHPTVGAAWWLREQGTAVHTLQVPAGVVQVTYGVDTDDGLTGISARAEWAPEFLIHQLASVEALADADPADYSDDVEHYLWTWIDEDAGALRSRMFANNLGIAEDEATGAAAVRITEHLSRDLDITQGKGSQIRTRWSPPAGCRSQDAWSTMALARCTCPDRSAGRGHPAVLAQSADLLLEIIRRRERAVHRRES